MPEVSRRELHTMPAAAASIESGKVSDDSESEADEPSELSKDAHAKHQVVYAEIDPADSDIFTDAFYAPLHAIFLRQMKDGSSKPRVLDYLFINVFLFVNVLVQLVVAWKVHYVTETEYGAFGEKLFSNTCWKIDTERSVLYGRLLPEWMRKESEGTFDCGPALVTLSMFPEQLDLNKDGFWSMAEAEEIMTSLPGIRPGSFPAALQRMIKLEHPGGLLLQNDKVKDKLDLNFFRRHKNDIRMCLPTDPAYCANMEVHGHLRESFPSDFDADERVHACKRKFTDFCQPIFGETFNSFYHSTQTLCGAASYTLKSGVNIVKYAEVDVYTGHSDSEFSFNFYTFLMLVVLIWILIMLSEFRQIFQFVEIVWKTPSTKNSEERFASLSEDGKMQVQTLPLMHKAYALGVIALARFGIAVVIFFAGVQFLCQTNNVLDLILNCTALGFLIEIDNLIHHAFLGAPFTKRVIDKCEAVQIPRSSKFSAWLSSDPNCSDTLTSIGYLVIVLFAILYTVYYFYTKKWGIFDIGNAVDCLCDIEGKCLAARLIEHS